MRRAVWHSVIVLLGAVLLSSAICMLLYHYDNKYTRTGPWAMNGMLLPNEDDLEKNPVMYLIHGWEIYRQKLLYPSDFRSGEPVPDAYISIGQYMGFELGDKKAEPHGSMTYRLRIAVPSDRQSYSLELPEIFSACRVYINGDLMASRGEVEKTGYRPEIKTGIVTFQAADKIEIIIQASDYSNIYSGLVYPPVFGNPEAVSLVINRRLLLHALVCIIAVIIAVCAFVFGRHNRKLTAYGFICLFFAGFTGYPILHAAGFSGSIVLLRMENLCFILILLTVSYLQRELCAMPKFATLSVMIIGVLVFACALFSALFFQSLTGMLLYSGIIRIYKYAVIVYLLFSTLYATAHGVSAYASLAGTSALGISVLMDRLLPLHEPILTGWLIEFGAAALVICIGLDLLQNGLQIMGEREVLRGHLRHLDGLFRLQKEHYHEIDEDIQKARISQHDTHHHVILMQSLLNEGNYEKLGEYLRSWGKTVENSTVTTYCASYVADVLFRHYAAVSRERGIPFFIEADIPRELWVTDTELCALLGNLLDNAFEATTQLPPEKQHIKAGIRQAGNNLVIVVENRFAERPVKSGNGFLSGKRGLTKTGTGLAAVSKIAVQYNGIAEFDVDTDSDIFRAFVQLENVCSSVNP